MTADPKRMLRFSAEPANESWFLRELAQKNYEKFGHTAEGQQVTNRLRRIAAMVEVGIELDKQFPEGDSR